MGELGRQHVAATYGREIVTSRWLTAIERVCELPSASINR
jgi:hypothetical protein